MKSAAIVSRQGLGDGLIMMICAYHLKKTGYHVTFFHNSFHELEHFFKNYSFERMPNKIEDLLSFDLLFIEYFNNPLIESILKHRALFKRIFIIYPTLNKKHLPRVPCDFVFDKKISMIENITKTMAAILNAIVKKSNEITPPSDLIHNKNKKRVVIHPTSLDKSKNWRKKRFIKLFEKVRALGYDPIFSLSKTEADQWTDEKIPIVSFNNFHDLASFIYESGYLIGNDSGPAHLASNLQIPTLVIASNKRTMKLWKPDFYKSEVITASCLIPNIKMLRIRNKYWAYFISTKKVLRRFLKICSKE